MLPDVRDFVGLSRDSRRETELAKELRRVSEPDRFRFLSDLLSPQPVVALELARKCNLGRKSLEALLGRGLREADASSIEVWLKCVVPQLGLRHVLHFLRQQPPDYRAAVKAAAYYLPEFGCTKEDLKDLLAA